MASHRKPKPRPLSPLSALSPFTAPTARAALTLALAGAAGFTALQGSGHARPRTPEPPAADRVESTDRVKSEVDRLHREAERATQDYNGAKEQSDTAQDRLERLRDRAARKARKLNASRDAVGSYAAAQYRDGSGADPALRLALSSSPDDYLERAAVAERAGDRQAAQVKRVAGQSRELARLRKEAAGTSDSLRKATERERTHKRTVRGKLGEAQRLLNRLTARERARVLEEPDGADGRAAPGDRASRDASRGGPRSGVKAASAPGTSGSPAASAASTVPAPGGRAGRAVAFARQAIGKPYVWGATGPSGYDCSGLTQAAWRAAGVSLPRTTYTQIDAGKRVPRSQLAPGDLVFFYNGLSHVGLYIGNGRMIHAPRPGTSVRVAPISEMPFAGATRPG